MNLVEPAPARPVGAAAGHDVVVSIINYRTAELTIACVRSALADAEGSGLDVHVVVVDNASGDGSADRIADWLAGLGEVPVTLIRSARNTGFSGGHNQGIGARRARTYLILNSDAELRPGALRALHARMAAEPEAGLVAPRLVGEDGAPQISCFRLFSPLGELVRGAASGPVTRLLRRRELALSVHPDPDEIEWMSFACILLRGEMVERLGPLDEGYFLYFEDVDYCWRARRDGWRLRYAPEAEAVHHRGGSGPVKALAAAKRRLPPYYYASRTRFFRRVYGRFGPLAANLSWLAGRGLARLRPLTGRPARRAAAGEARDVWTNFLDPLGDSRAPEA